jgi:hypothetical protein
MSRRKEAPREKANNNMAILAAAPLEGRRKFDDKEKNL